MKKVFLYIIAILLVGKIQAQQKSVMPESRANTPNNTIEPKINGMPYSVWVAQEKAKQNSNHLPGIGIGNVNGNRQSNTLKPVGDDPTTSKVAVPVSKNTNAQKPNVLSPGENRKPIPVTNPAEVVKTETPQQKVSTPDFSHPASVTAAGNTAANKTTTPTVGDAGKNVPAGSVMGSVKPSTEGTVIPNGNATNLPPDTYDPKGAKQVSNKVATTDQNVKPVVSEVKTEKSTLPPVAVPVSAGSKGN